MQRTNHMTSSMGLHYACFRLAERCWNVSVSKMSTKDRSEGSCSRRSLEIDGINLKPSRKSPITSLIGCLFLITTTKAKVDVSGTVLEILKQ